jgi:ATP-dependent RNA helicase DDX27
MIAHKDEIYSRPKRTWFATEKEKKTLAKAAKVGSSYSFMNDIFI